MRNNHKPHRIITVILTSILLSGCGAGYNAPASYYSNEPGAGNLSTSNPGISNPSASNPSADILTTAEPETEADSGTEPGTIASDENSRPPAIEDKPEIEDGDTSIDIEDTPSPSSSLLSSSAVGSMPSAEEPDTRTEDEKLADTILEVCSTKATVETSYSACVVDIRKAGRHYDVSWDYGSEYNYFAGTNMDIWDSIFDIEYYKNTFPMLAMLHHDDYSLLYTHFVTVGIHEGRQGSENFNVNAFMDVCPDWVRAKFGDNYACYYMYYVHSAEVDRSADLSGESYPKQMTAIMTAVQREEFENINKERERLGVEPLVFDSELAAFANYRCWINAAENYAAHDWAKQNNDVLWDIVAVLNGNYISENTTSRFIGYFNGWYRGYAGSESHYNAMVNTKWGCVGNSNVYACDNTLEQYANYKSDTRWVHFDVFMDTVGTALNHE